MRAVSEKEMKKRGCKECANFNNGCMFDKCPYNELNDLKDYYKEFDEPKRKVKLDKRWNKNKKGC